MADPLSITASIVGIVGPALHATRLLLQDLQQLKDAPKTVKRLVDDVHSVTTTLDLLQSIEEREWGSLGGGVAKQAETTISSSTQACNLFRDDLQKWTRHSEDGKLAWLDRANVGFFKKDQVKFMSEQLQSCKLAINLIVGVATLYSSVRNTHLTEEIKKTISTRQNEVKGAITTADKQLTVLENKVEEMNLSDGDEEVATAAEGKTDILRQLEEELKGVKASQKLLGELLSKSQEEAVARAAKPQSSSITATFGAQNSGFQVGNINGGVSGIKFGGK
ncbi:uncharacterized protein LY89DRAFT_572503 [Mollisia scopiformis]|uniref:Azaphilone pigments biosynthesis cluster protein L N-terminal domain-containing protein n=1 Tax=Mollisia scopiformis TaxID=149040 RepID=A0A194XV58_MOLSC|nr:uncharacterized protein LY89DRAFT_572503 [Mollisia scopiformis]KUJ24021.1 hypothetical protein LY89DRAFT_572503 [Mollisia scopiformis]